MIKSHGWMGPIEIATLAAILLIVSVPAHAAERAGADAPTDSGLTLELIFDSEELTSPLPTQIMWLPGGDELIYLQHGTPGDAPGAASDHHAEDPTGTDTWLWRENARSGERVRITSWSAMHRELAAQRPGFDRPRVLPVDRASRAGLRPVLAPNGRLLAGLAAGDLFVLDLVTGQARFLTDDGEPELFWRFAPTSDRLAFAKQGDLYWIGLTDGVVHRLTDRGADDALLNGVADWVAEEELGIQSSFWWSPDGTRIAFVQYDTSPIPPYPITDELAGRVAALELQRYPKAGTDNSMVRLGIIDLPGTGGTDRPASPRWVGLGGGGEHYLVRAGWTPSGSSLWFQRLSRDQTRLELRLADPGTGRSRLLLTEHDPAWVNVCDDLTWLDDEHFVWSSERDGWRHLYLYEVRDGRAGLVRRLTSGEWEVRAVYGLDAAGTGLLIQATEAGPLERHLYRVALDGSGLERLSHTRGSHEATPAPAAALAAGDQAASGGRLYLDRTSNLETPPRLELHRADGSLVRVVADGAIPALDRFRLAPCELSRVTADDGTVLHAATIRPPHFDPAQRYPVLLYVYGGPSSQLVRDAWGGRRHLFFQLLARHGLVVHWVDNRGTTARGRDFERAVHRRLGELELADQLAAVRQLVAEPWVDADRIGIYGGSYGGFMTLKGMLEAPEVFRAGIAYAPGTDWALYDTIWTERYMDTPEANPEGYRASSMIDRADRLDGDLLLVHGTMDNNVHIQHTLRLIDALVRHDKAFEVMIYPQIRHPIRVSRNRLHFHRLKTRFLLEHLVHVDSSPDPSPAAGDHAGG